MTNYAYVANRWVPTFLMIVSLQFLSYFVMGHKLDKMLSYRRETALQGALVLAKSGRLELGDNILRTIKVYLQPLWHNRPAKLSNSVKTQNRGYYAVQGHSRSSRSVRTDGQTEFSSIDRVCIPCSAVKTKFSNTRFFGLHYCQV